MKKIEEDDIDFGNIKYRLDLKSPDQIIRAAEKAMKNMAMKMAFEKRVSYLNYNPFKKVKKPVPKPNFIYKTELVHEIDTEKL